jgi:ribosomal protein L37AE/L43A
VVGDQAIDMELAVRAGASGIWLCDSGSAQESIAGGTFRVAAGFVGRRPVDRG